MKPGETHISKGHGPNIINSPVTFIRPMHEEDIEYIYLASQFGRQAEMRSIRDRLEKNPMVRVVARWIDEEPFDHQPTKEELITMSDRDLNDLESSGTFVLINPPPYLGGPEELSRGGRMVEAGVALGLQRSVRDIKLVVVGENNCVHLAGGQWTKFKTVEDFIKWVKIENK